MREDIKDTLLKNEGALEFLYTLFTPSIANQELPDPPYILIRWVEAKPKGRQLLLRYAADMIAQIQTNLGRMRTIIFQPAANGNGEDQEKLVAYYRSCGFDYLPSSKSKFWMTWPKNT